MTREDTVHVTLTRVQACAVAKTAALVLGFAAGIVAIPVLYATTATSAAAATFLILAAMAGTVALLARGDMRFFAAMACLWCLWCLCCLPFSVSTIVCQVGSMSWDRTVTGILLGTLAFMPCAGIVMAAWAVRDYLVRTARGVPGLPGIVSSTAWNLLTRLYRRMLPTCGNDTASGSDNVE